MLLHITGDGTTVLVLVLVLTTVQGTKKASRLGRVVKNLVTNDEKERMKEEMAWQVIFPT